MAGIQLAFTDVPVFRFTSAQHAQKLTAIAKVIEKNLGEAVLLQGESVPGIYIIGEGKVGVYPPGAARPLSFLERGEAFGEMSFLEKTKASITIRSEQAGTKLAVMLQQDLAQLIAADSELGRAIYQGLALTLSQKLRSTTARIAAELQTGRELIAELGRATDLGGVSAPLAQLPAEVEGQNARILKALDEGLTAISGLSQKPLERHGALATVAAKLAETRQLYLSYFPRLAQQVGAFSHFIRKMEEMVLNSTHE